MHNILAILLLPFTVTVLIPASILQATGGFQIRWALPSPVEVLPVLFGIVLFGFGLFFVIGTIRLFAIIGRGTLAPWHPPQKLVVQGPYRFVRNPMITGVLCILLGESIFFGSVPLFYWFLFAAVLNGLYIPLVEEPGLIRRFGESYLIYRKNVPRWMPRLHPWEGQDHPAP